MNLKYCDSFLAAEPTFCCAISFPFAAERLESAVHWVIVGTYLGGFGLIEICIIVEHIMI
uniref:Uncharacterized protein n=1 Tax=Rhizophora mucronata TaxID=61149 RepID=A0A2P2NX83_RHIMU